SGYSRVTFSVSIRCRKVSAIPLRVARKYDVVPRGRSNTFTPIAIRRLPPFRSLHSLDAGRYERRLRFRLRGRWPTRRPLARDDRGEPATQFLPQPAPRRSTGDHAVAVDEPEEDCHGDQVDRGQDQSVDEPELEADRV